METETPPPLRTCFPISMASTNNNNSSSSFVSCSSHDLQEVEISSIISSSSIIQIPVPVPVLDKQQQQHQPEEEDWEKTDIIDHNQQQDWNFTDSSFVVSQSINDPYEARSTFSSSRIQIVQDEVEIPELELELELELQWQRQRQQQEETYYDVIDSRMMEVTPPRESIIEQGVALTWEDLWVTVSNGKKGGSSSRAILQGLTGYARPGQLLAIMGPSGCGKSTLLDALAGRLGSNTRQSGEILINGCKQALAYGTSAYVTQDEALITTLTIKEAVYYSAELQLPNSMSKLEKKERSETIIKEMGLQDAMNTRIGGGWGAKGLSGGQKRRVSICIEMLTRPKLLFLDEPTSGLDSAASYYVISRIARQREGKTIVASIHQPSAEVFSLFDNLCLLSSGRTVYFGPVTDANQFFSFCGFPCPPLQNPSDHFLKTINKDFDEDIEEGRKTTEQVIDTLVQSYISSDSSRQVQLQVSELCKRGRESPEMSNISRKRANFFTQCQVLTRRSFVNMYRDIGYYWMRLAVYIVLTIGLGTMYFHVGSDYNSIQARGSMLMFVASFLTFMATCGFPSFMEEMKVFQRERLNGHYGSGAFATSNTVSATPYLLLVSLIPGAIAYFMTGLQEGIGAGNATENFIYFALMLFVCMLLVEGQMMIVASLVPNFLSGLIIGSGIQGIMILGGGFFRLPNDIPAPFWKYPLYHISFHKYAYQGLFKNDLEGRTFSGPNAVNISGETILRNTWQVEMGYSKWVNIGILLGMMIFYRLLFFVIVKAGENLKPALRSFFLSLSRSNQATQIMVVDPSPPLSSLNPPQI